MAEVEQIPIIVVTPILDVLAAKVCGWMVGSLWWKELACSACCQWDLNAAKANVPVDVVFEDECCVVSRI